jgi:peptidoglycan/xylan/chitin deacetylase (PgdA/CDA1 family)
LNNRISKKIIIKVDDLFLHLNFFNYKKFIDICVNQNIKSSFGCVGLGLLKASKSEIYYLKSHLESGFIDLWNHGTTHKNLTKISNFQKAEEILICQKILKDKFDYKCKVFGAPYNQYNIDVMDAISKNSDIELVYFTDESIWDGNLKVIKRNSLFTGEYYDFGRRYFSAKKALDFISKEYSELVVLQVHPWSWSENCFVEFNNFLRELINKGFVSISSHDYLKFDSEHSSFLDQFSISKIGDDAVHNVIKQGVLVDSYYKNIYANGISAQINGLKRIGFDKDINDNQPDRLLDIGAGVGDWAVSYKYLKPTSEVFCVELLKSAASIFDEIKKSGDFFNDINYLNCDANKLDGNNFDANYFSKCIIPDAIQYLDPNILFSNVSKWIRPGGYLFISGHTSEHYIISMLDAYDRGDFKLAYDRCMILISNKLSSFGLSHNSRIRLIDPKTLSLLGQVYGFTTVNGNLSITNYVNHHANGAKLFEFLFQRDSTLFGINRVSQLLVGNRIYDLLYDLISIGCAHFVLKYFESIPDSDRNSFSDLEMLCHINIGDFSRYELNYFLIKNKDNVSNLTLAMYYISIGEYSLALDELRLDKTPLDSKRFLQLYCKWMLGDFFMKEMDLLRLNVSSSDFLFHAAVVINSKLNG